MSEHNCTGAEAKAIYRKFWASQINASVKDPIAFFIYEMRQLGYPAIQASLFYSVISIAQKEIKQEMGNKLAVYIKKLG